MANDTEINVGTVDMDEEEDPTLADKLRGVREKLQRKQTATRAKRRAKARRIEKEDPNNLGETLAVKQNRLEEATKEAKKAVGDFKSLAETKFGAADSESDGGSVIESLSDGIGNITGDIDTESLSEPITPIEGEAGMDMEEPIDVEAVSEDDIDVVDGLDDVDEPVEDDFL